MLDGNRDPDDSAYATKESPSYGLFDKETLISIGTGGVLMLLTILGMIFLANTSIAELALKVFNIAAILGVIVFGLLLTIGRYAGLHGVDTNNTPLAIFGSVLLVATYSIFGAAILSRYSTSLYTTAIVITSGITVAITLLAALAVYVRDASFENWSKYSGMFFLVGLVFVAIGYVFSPVLILGFICFLLGFLCDLVYEIWAVSSKKRTPFANGISLYVAFAGVFVHVMQLVLQALAEQ